ncbi:hypothetical protein [Alkaliphilus transvaalensis]|uniref:hypothetical protein n=1 Tax=Alkaliphilus transvaalensis TaxID=114628 RepID=UPI00047AAAF3|nr:hypothetical protein [Alkaliphilus transvaalensis]
MGETFSWITFDFLMTFTGAVFVTNIITHFIKDYLPDSIDKKIVTLLTAVVVVLANVVIFDKISLQNVYLAVINAFFVAAAAMGNYEILTTKTKKAMIKELAAQKEINEIKVKKEN